MGELISKFEIEHDGFTYCATETRIDSEQRRLSCCKINSNGMTVQFIDFCVDKNVPERADYCRDLLLVYSAAINKFSLAKRLLEAGANPKAQYPIFNKKSVSDFALAQKNWRLLSLLSKYDKDNREQFLTMARGLFQTSNRPVGESAPTPRTRSCSL